MGMGRSVGRKKPGLQPHPSSSGRGGKNTGVPKPSAVSLSRERELGAALDDCEERFRKLIYFIPSVAIQGYDTNGVVLHWNRASEVLFGYTAEEAIGKRLPDLILPPELHPIFPQCLDAGRNVCSSGEYMPPGEMMLRRKDGSYVPTYTIHTAVCAEGREPMLFCIHMDLSERRRMEEERRQYESKLQQYDKLQSLRALAGGVAHDFNNQIQAVLGYLDLAQASLPDATPQSEYLKQAYAAAERAGRVSRNMLSYLGQGKYDQARLDLSELLRHLVDRIVQTMPTGARIDFQLCEELPLIQGDTYQISEAVMNLITNAAEALTPSSGPVKVATSVQACERDFLDRIRFDERLPEGIYVCVSVTDTGCGMSPEVLRRVFDPFYSTKFAGRGLGLATTLGIMQAHRGGILLESRADEGTTCELYFPVA